MVHGILTVANGSANVLFLSKLLILATILSFKSGMEFYYEILRAVKICISLALRIIK